MVSAWSDLPRVPLRVPKRVRFSRREHQYLSAWHPLLVPGTLCWHPLLLALFLRGRCLLMISVEHAVDLFCGVGAYAFHGGDLVDGCYRYFGR